MSFLSSVVSETAIVIDFYSEHKGKTLFLLKQTSKPVPQVRKRIKRDIFGEDHQDT